MIRMWRSPVRTNECDQPTSHSHKWHKLTKLMRLSVMSTGLHLAYSHQATILHFCTVYAVITGYYVSFEILSYIRRIYPLTIIIVTITVLLMLIKSFSKWKSHSRKWRGSIYILMQCCIKVGMNETMIQGSALLKPDEGSSIFSSAQMRTRSRTPYGTEIYGIWMSLFRWGMSGIILASRMPIVVAKSRMIQPHLAIYRNEEVIYI